MSASSASARHETRALLRAHLAAATSYRHLTRHCPICHRLLRLALEPSQPSQPAQGERRAPEAAFIAGSAAEGESGGKAGGKAGGESGRRTDGEGSEDESPPNA
ncbi:DUF6274 family protein [Streptomyces sp. NPDC046465]|uniref:DUF6274 family protein n=1 Tax=Streptomyces sp. NPDC046465 TaxID=3155810 RepID=UPI0033F2A9A1